MCLSSPTVCIFSVFWMFAWSTSPSFASAPTTTHRIPARPIPAFGTFFPGILQTHPQRTVLESCQDWYRSPESLDFSRPGHPNGANKSRRDVGARQEPSWASDLCRPVQITAGREHIYQQSGRAVGLAVGKDGLISWSHGGTRGAPGASISGN